MGGVRSFDGEQASVQLWNPAGMAFSKGLRWDLFNIDAGINGQDAYDLGRTMGSVNGIEDLDAFYGKPIWVGAAASSSLMFPYIGFSYSRDITADLVLHNPILPEFKVKYYSDEATMLGAAAKVGAFGVGLNLKQIVRTGNDTAIGADLLTAIDQTALQAQIQGDKGVGYGLDFGVMYKPDVLLNPVVSLGYQNVGDTTFQKTGGTSAPPAIQDNLTLGATISADALIAGFTTGFEYRHINTTGEPIGKKIHFGAEVNLLNIDLRAGFYQGYPSYGLGLDLFLLQLDAALYTIERGAYPGQTPEQRVQVGLSASFGFDADFNLMSLGGKKRKLKQRR